MSRNKLKTLGGPALLLTGGALIGAVAAGAFTANAAEAPTPAGSPSAAPPRDGGGGHPAETPLTGTTKSKVEAAVLAKYPAAKIERTETDSDGVYESHITTASGQHLIVKVDKNFTVTGTETFDGRHGPGHDGRGGRPGETPLTGTTKSKVEAAVLAKYPGAKIERTETDGDGVYESHITTASGQHITVEVNKNFVVTGTETHPGPGPGLGPR